LLQPKSASPAVSFRMATPALSNETQQRIRLLFPLAEQDLVAELLLEECGNNLPGLEALDAAQIDRFRFAVLKISGGDLGKLDEALRLAKVDWRDLLMDAGFDEDVTAHEHWLADDLKG
jgi:hypothetical protein